MDTTGSTGAYEVTFAKGSVSVLAEELIWTEPTLKSSSARGMKGMEGGRWGVIGK